MESLAKTTDECKMESLAKATDECNEQLKASSLQDKPSPSRKQEAVSVGSGDQHKRDQMNGYNTLKQIEKKHRAERFSLGDLKKEYSTVFEQTVQLCGTQVPFGKLFEINLKKNYELCYCNCNEGDTEVSLSVALRILDKFIVNPTENEADFIRDEHIFVQRTLTRADNGRYLSCNVEDLFKEFKKGYSTEWDYSFLSQYDKKSKDYVPVQKYNDTFSYVKEEWLRSKPLQPQVDYEYSEENLHELLDDDHIPMLLIMGPAGSGKSTYLRWLAQYIEQYNPAWWVVRFSVTEHSCYLSAILKGMQSETGNNWKAQQQAIQTLFRIYFYVHLVASGERHGKRQALSDAEQLADQCCSFLRFGGEKLYLNECSCPLPFEQTVMLRLFVEKFNANELWLLFDEFNELPQGDKALVWNMFNALQNVTTKKTMRGLYVTSRTEEPGNLFRRQTLYLKPYSVADQIAHINKLLDNIDFCVSLSVEQREELSLTFYSLTGRLVSYYNSILAEPLFLEMFCRLWSVAMPYMLQLENFTISRKLIDLLTEPRNLTIYQLLQHFNGSRYYAKILSPKCRAFGIYQTSHNFKVVCNTHDLGRLAMCTLFGEQTVKALLSPYETQFTSLMERLRTSIFNSRGVFKGVVNGVPIFKHQLFVELYAASWLSENLLSPKVASFYRTHVHPSMGRVRTLLDSIVISKCTYFEYTGAPYGIRRAYRQFPHHIQPNVVDELGHSPDALFLADTLSTVYNTGVGANHLLNWLEIMQHAPAAGTLFSTVVFKAAPIDVAMRHGCAEATERLVGSVFRPTAFDEYANVPNTRKWNVLSHCRTLICRDGAAKLEQYVFKQLYDEFTKTSSFDGWLGVNAFTHVLHPDLFMPRKFHLFDTWRMKQQQSIWYLCFFIDAPQLIGDMVRTMNVLEGTNVVTRLKEVKSNNQPVRLLLVRVEERNASRNLMIYLAKLHATVRDFEAKKYAPLYLNAPTVEISSYNYDNFMAIMDI
ncbi:uncharacterized protein LOC121598834 [Anopheles merus]|uniref:uncharacterized protein LOC121598834 n=1 Tax=Anopheles merus TaxID=30066 RepID=UPI001BE461D4|nr:uncharacterized protein LOC121598834 [Anopheles merus]